MLVVFLQTLFVLAMQSNAQHDYARSSEFATISWDGFGELAE
jgi:hypothetical protein